MHPAPDSVHVYVRRSPLQPEPHAEQPRDDPDDQPPRPAPRAVQLGEVLAAVLAGDGLFVDGPAAVGAGDGDGALFIGVRRLINDVVAHFDSHSTLAPLPK